MKKLGSPKARHYDHHPQTRISKLSPGKPEPTASKANKSKTSHGASKSPYSGFDRLNGQHDYMAAVPKGYVLYPVRNLQRGRVTFLNFELAADMGLIPAKHPHQLNSHLEQKILEAFSIQIINEYDQINRRRIDKGLIKPKMYMATRYLQLQHPDKRGLTSGDGRSIWNGQIRNKGVTWDVSSRGTGVTRLSPGVQEAGKFLRTGQNEFGYGCGLAELDELYGTAIMAEVFHRSNIPTERLLTIIDLGGGVGIGVRAAPNLIRPAHLFSFLKQSDHESLKQACDYLIERQHRNGRWKISPNDTKKYRKMAHQIALDFASFVAILETNYIFAWMDWDGDNILADAGIIDYGSIRQFGLRHDQYRYDDVDRFSTNLNEQKGKARYIVQTFLQIADYIESGKKRTIQNFHQHPSLKRFDAVFNHTRTTELLRQCGFDELQITFLQQFHKQKVKEFEKSFKRLEQKKTASKPQKVEDGINKPAIYNMRSFLREMPLALEDESKRYRVSSKEVFDWIISSQASSKDRKLTQIVQRQIRTLQASYIQMIRTIERHEQSKDWLQGIISRSQHINRPDRMTGNSISLAVDEMMSDLKRGLPTKYIQEVIDSFIEYQSKPPIRRQSDSASSVVKGKATPSRKLLQKLIQCVEDASEDI
ncbi:MAG: hypothetical protein COT74_05825 [Bdellovibrionales bacterium CG10_big_fil_rev_8_21_14_0_10_45_34]|nr:MAG: hypothetical protein COT74_05825 [Bdellovibrionales bacterium CG10_big_fil_rev_8_21_14_0_10_45_34]